MALDRDDRRPFFDISNSSGARSAKGRISSGVERSRDPPWGGRDPPWGGQYPPPITLAANDANLRRLRAGVRARALEDPHVRPAFHPQRIEPRPFAALSRPTSPRLRICAHLCNLWSNFERSEIRHGADEPVEHFRPAEALLVIPIIPNRFRKTIKVNRGKSD